MTYVSWVGVYEGATDRAYLEVLLPRLMEELVLARGTRRVTIPPAPALGLGLKGRTVAEVAEEICANQDSFHLVFVHGDTGGRNLERGVDKRVVAYCAACHELCGWPQDRCVGVVPRHEIEAWALADPAAVLEALGYVGRPEELGIPSNAIEAERLPDPKAVLVAAYRAVRGRRAGEGIVQLLTSIAQTQSFAALRTSDSFAETERRMVAALSTLGVVAA